MNDGTKEHNLTFCFHSELWIYKQHRQEHGAINQNINCPYHMDEALELLFCLIRCHMRKFVWKIFRIGSVTQKKTKRLIAKENIADNEEDKSRSTVKDMDICKRKKEHFRRPNRLSHCIPNTNRELGIAVTLLPRELA
jgi:hypothetical protein